MKFFAHFTPEAWVNDQAVEIDAGGSQEWDCTEFAQSRLDYLEGESTNGDSMDDEFGVLDRDDVFKEDPAAPDWVREHRGPFTIRIRRTSEPSDSYTFTVTISGCSPEQASQVMAERIGYDEDYGFDYTIKWA